VKDGFHYPSVAEVLRVTITPGATAKRWNSHAIGAKRTCRGRWSRVSIWRKWPWADIGRIEITRWSNPGRL
jgi:hypothetical protein